MKRELKITAAIILFSLAIFASIFAFGRQVHRYFGTEDYPALTFEELVDKSDLIIEGSVSKLYQAKENPKSGRVQTDINIHTDHLLKGICGETVKIRIDEGTSRYIEEDVREIPSFTLGEKVLLFLCRDDSDDATDEDYYKLLYGRQGKYIRTSYLLGAVGDRTYKNTAAMSKNVISVNELTEMLAGRNE